MALQKYRLSEVFYSIQGEGPWAGQPMVFVRMAGCNLRCSWCDTDFSFTMKLTADELEKLVVENSSRCRHVCFTGGEPTASIDRSLVEHFRNVGFLLHLETNGMYPVPGDGLFTSIVVSPKLPGRLIKDWDEVIAYWKELLKFRRLPATLKVVYDTSKEFDLKTILADWAGLPWARRYLQPLWLDGGTNLEVVMAAAKADPSWSISVQQHKDWGLR